ISRKDLTYTSDGTQLNYTDTIKDSAAPDITETVVRSGAQAKNTLLTGYTETTTRTSGGDGRRDTVSSIDHTEMTYDSFARLVKDVTVESDIYGVVSDHEHSQSFDTTGRVNDTLDPVARRGTDIVTTNHRYDILYNKRGEQASYTETQQSTESEG